MHYQQSPANQNAEIQNGCQALDRVYAGSVCGCANYRALILNGYHGLLGWVGSVSQGTMAVSETSRPEREMFSEYVAFLSLTRPLGSAYGLEHHTDQE